MTIMQKLSTWGEGFPVPDAVSRMVIASLVGRTARSLAAQSADAMAQQMAKAGRPVTPDMEGQLKEKVEGIIAQAEGRSNRIARLTERAFRE